MSSFLRDIHWYDWVGTRKAKAPVLFPQELHMALDGLKPFRQGFPRLQGKIRRSGVQQRQARQLSRPVGEVQASQKRFQGGFHPQVGVVHQAGGL